MSKKTLSVSLLLIFALALILAGCGGQAPQQAKVLKVGSDTAFAPFEFQDEKSKEYVGFDMDLIKAVGKQLGYEVKVQGMGFDGLIPALEAGQIDAVISAMTITAERGRKVNFSKPYYTSGLSIVVKSDNAAVKEFKDLDGRRIAVQIGTTGADFAKKIKDAKIVGQPLNAEDYGIATAKKNTELAQKIDKALDELKKNGEYDKIYEKWFGKKPAK